MNINQLKAGSAKALLQPAQNSSRADKWMKPNSTAVDAGGNPIGKNQDGGIRSALEKRMDEMRKFMDVEQDENTMNESLDFTFSHAM